MTVLDVNGTDTVDSLQLGRLIAERRGEVVLKAVLGSMAVTMQSLGWSSRCLHKHLDKNSRGVLPLAQLEAALAFAKFDQIELALVCDTLGRRSRPWILQWQSPLDGAEVYLLDVAKLVEAVECHLEWELPDMTGCEVLKDLCHGWEGRVYKLSVHTPEDFQDEDALFQAAKSGKTNPQGTDLHVQLVGDLATTPVLVLHHKSRTQTVPDLLRKGFMVPRERFEPGTTDEFFFHVMDIGELRSLKLTVPSAPVEFQVPHFSVETFDGSESARSWWTYGSSVEPELIESTVRDTPEHTMIQRSGKTTLSNGSSNLRLSPLRPVKVLKVAVPRAATIFDHWRRNPQGKTVSSLARSVRLRNWYHGQDRESQR
jgi:hypothetical protein